MGKLEKTAFTPPRNTQGPRGAPVLCPQPNDALEPFFWPGRNYCGPRCLPQSALECASEEQKLLSFNWQAGAEPSEKKPRSALCLRKPLASLLIRLRALVFWKLSGFLILSSLPSGIMLCIPGLPEVPGCGHLTEFTPESQGTSVLVLMGRWRAFETENQVISEAFNSSRDNQELVRRSGNSVRIVVTPGAVHVRGWASS